MLSVAKNNRYLVKNGVFFPYLADTAWTLLQRLTRAEIVYYLDKRAQQGYNAIQVSAISELDGLRVPNREGQLPFGEHLRPNPAYFALVTFLADECEKRGIVLVLLPTWGDKFNRKWGIGPEIFTPDNAFVYGKYLASLIGGRENVIWMLGGDRPIETELHRTVIDEMARGLRVGERVRHLITYHPAGESSSAAFLAASEYIDFHALQSGHSFGGFKSEKMVSRTLKIGRRPCLDAECFYEDFPIAFDTAWGYRLCARDIRRRIYKNMMAGALGHTYGHQSVWCFRECADEEYLYDWRRALDRPMAQQMRYVNQLLGLVDITASRSAAICCGATACVGEDYILVYLENDEPAFIDIKAHRHVRSAHWFDPVTGTLQDAAVANRYITAVSPFGHDAVLILMV